MAVAVQPRREASLAKAKAAGGGPGEPLAALPRYLRVNRLQAPGEAG